METNILAKKNKKKLHKYEEKTRKMDRISIGLQSSVKSSTIFIEWSWQLDRSVIANVSVVKMEVVCPLSDLNQNV